MIRPKCIFCLTTDKSLFNTREHIIPESLGSEDWAILPEGLFCDNCQNIFGSSVEQQALLAYPFIDFRVLMGIPTKKGKAPWFEYLEGQLYSSGKGIGSLRYIPNKYFEESTRSGRKTHTIISTSTDKTDMVLRTLLKIGIETFAADIETKDEVFDKKFDSAREYALKGRKNRKWFYIIRDDQNKLNEILKKGQITTTFWYHNFFATVYEDFDSIFLHLKLLYLDIMAPLTENVLDKMDLNVFNNDLSTRVIRV